MHEFQSTGAIWNGCHAALQHIEAADNVYRCDRVFAHELDDVDASRRAPSILISKAAEIAQRGLKGSLPFRDSVDADLNDRPKLVRPTVYMPAFLRELALEGALPLFL